MKLICYDFQRAVNISTTSGPSTRAPFWRWRRQAAGSYLLRSLGGTDGIVPVVRRLEAKFRKPANGVTTSNATATDSALDELRAGLAVKGRGLISVNVELHDSSGAHVLSATVEWFIATAPRPNSWA